jgi:hypothetical protein
MVHVAATRPTAISFNASGDTTIIAAQAGRPLCVYGLFFTVDGATNVTFKDGASTLLSGAVVLTGNGSSINLQPQDEPYYTTTIGNGFVLNSTNAVTFSGTVWFTYG